MNSTLFKYFLIYMIIFSGILFPISFSYSQNNIITEIKGVVVDSKTNEPMPFVSVVFVDKNIGTRTDFDGKFILNSREASKKIKFSYMGYASEIKNVIIGKRQVINCKLNHELKRLDEVVIKPEKIKYKNKDNPAVKLIENVIQNKAKNRKEGFDYIEYNKYEKTQFALSNINEKFMQKKSFKKFQFVFDNIDTTKLEGKKILPIYLKETLSKYYYRKSPKDSKEIIKANKKVNFEGYVDNQGIEEYLKYLYQDINIYDNNVTLLTNQFLSPIAGSAPTFYKYFILDTSYVDNTKCAKVFFSPRNKTDMLFQGTFWITLDSSYVIKKIDMSVNNNINLNWVKDLKIVQEFDKMEDGNWILSSDEISVDFGLSKNKMGIFGQRAVYYKDYKINKIRGDSTYTGLKLVVDKNAEKHDAIFWEKNRFQQLSKSEKGTYDVIDSVKKVPAFRRTMDILMILLEGYKDVGYFDVGPVSTFYSYNPIEGLRLRFGGRTTNKFSKKYNIESYLAYGFKDENFKYYLGGTYSLTERNVFEFPVKSIKVSYQDETKIPGQELQFVQEDNFLLSIKRGVNDKLLYNKTFKIEHLNEFNNHFSYTLGFENIIQRPSGSLFYNTMDYSLHNNNPDKVNISELYVNLRYAPNEQFYQGKSYRIPIELKYPVFQLQYSLGSKYLQNDYNYNKLILRIDKRFNMSVIGYSDVSIEYGKIFGTVSYPELFIARANQTYSYQLQSYNLMNFLEFVSDEYASLNYEHCFNGFIFNKIPIVKKLKLREIISCKALYGKVSDRNNPENNKDLFKFPVDNNSVPITYTLDKQPYIEASVGIANIFKLFRIDLVRRLTYTDHPNVSSTGIRARFKLDF